MDQSIAAGIESEYDAKGFSRHTLAIFQNKQDEIMENATRFAVSFQIIFPLLMVFFICLVIYFAMYKPNLRNIRAGHSDKTIPKEHHDYLDDSRVPSKKNLRIVTTVLSSFVFVLYTIGLDITAIIFWMTRNTTDLHQDSVHELERAIPPIMLAEDATVLLIMTISFSCCYCSHLTPRWYFILVGPLSSIGVHFYHIMLGFIETPRHAGSIAIAYGLTISIFLVTLNVVYYLLYGLYNGCRKFKWYQRLQKRSCCHKLYQLVNCCQDQISTHKHVHKHKHKIFKCHCHPWPHSCFSIVLFITAVLMALFTAFVVALFFIVPINSAVEDAALSLQTINNVIVIFFTGAITIKIFKDKKHSIIDLLVQTRNRDTKAVDLLKKKVAVTLGNQQMQTAVNKLREATTKQQIEKAANEFVQAATDKITTAAVQQAKGDESIKAAACEVVWQRAKQLRLQLKDVQIRIADSSHPVTKAMTQLVTSLKELFEDNIKNVEGRVNVKTSMKQVGVRILQMCPKDPKAQSVCDAAYELMKAVVSQMQLQSTHHENMDFLIRSIKGAILKDDENVQDPECVQAAAKELMQAIRLLTIINKYRTPNDTAHANSQEPSRPPAGSNTPINSPTELSQVEGPVVSQINQLPQVKQAIKTRVEYLANTACVAAAIQPVTRISSARENVKTSTMRLVKKIAPNAQQRNTVGVGWTADNSEIVVPIICEEVHQYLAENKPPDVLEKVGIAVKRIQLYNPEEILLDKASQLITSVVDAEACGWHLLQEISNQLLGQKSEKDKYEETAQLVVQCAVKDFLPQGFCNQGKHKKRVNRLRFICCKYRGGDPGLELKEGVARKLTGNGSGDFKCQDAADKLLEEVIKQVDETAAEEVAMAAARVSPKLSPWEDKSGRERKEAMGSFLLQTLISLEKSQRHTT